MIPFFNLFQTSLRAKFVFLILSISIIPLCLIAAVDYWHAQKRLKERSFEHLVSVREVKRKEIEWYFDKLKEETYFFAQSKLMVEAMKEFKIAFNSMHRADLPQHYQTQLQAYYHNSFKDIPRLGTAAFSIDSLAPIDARGIYLQNQFLVGTKAAKVTNAYSDVHDRYHQAISAFINTYDLYDLFLIDDDSGYVIYSVVKEPEFATSLLHGPYQNTNLGKLFRTTRNIGLKTQTQIVDFERYLPSRLAPASFISAPIFDKDKKIGTLVLQVPLKKLEEITTGRKAWESEGMGKTGETYLIGPDRKLRTDSRFIIENPGKHIQTLYEAQIISTEEVAMMKLYKTAILIQQMNSAPAQNSLNELKGSTISKDYRNTLVLSSYAPLIIDGLQWGILVEMDYDEVMASVRQAGLASIAFILTIMAVAIFAAIYFGRSLYKPILQMAEAASKISVNTQYHPPFQNRKDELGQLSEALENAVKEIRTKHEEISNQNAQLEFQNSQLLFQAEELQALNNQISELNQHLDKKVSERTAKLIKQNELLSQYAFMNSHKLRAPIARLQGLVNIIRMENSKEDLDFALSQIEFASKELDEVVHEIQDILNAAESPNEPLD